MFCPNCGTKNIENALFCCNCGIKLEDFTQTPAPAVEPENTPEVEAADNTAEAAATTEPSAESEIPMEPEVTSVPEVTVEPEETDTTEISAEPEDTTESQNTTQPEENTESVEAAEPTTTTASDSVYNSPQTGSFYQAPQQTQDAQIPNPNPAPANTASYQMPNQPQMQPNPYAAPNGYSAPVYAPQRAPRKPINPFMIVSLVEIVAFCIMIAVFFKVGQNTFGYENVAKNYFKSIADCDWDQVYGELELKESAFINKDAFLEMRKEDDKISYSKINAESTADKNTALVTITYFEKGSDYASDELQVKLTRQSKKSFLFFDNWKVSSDNYVVNDFTIYAPQGADVYLDNQVIPDKYITKKSSTPDSDCYQIPQMFAGTHTSFISLDGFTGPETPVYAQYDYDYLSLEYDSLSVTSKQQEEILNTAYSILQKELAAGVAGNDFSTIEDLFADDYVADAKDSYNSYFLDNFTASGSRSAVKKLSLNNVTGSFSDFRISSGTIYAEVIISYDYTVDYRKKDWWTDKFEKATYDSDTSTRYYLQYQDGTWKLCSSSFPSIYYY